MSLREPRRRHETNYPQRLLAQLQRQLTERARKTSSYPELRDMVAIPRDLRAGPPKTLVGKGYVQPEDDDPISLTAAGTRLATSPFA